MEEEIAWIQKSDPGDPSGQRVHTVADARGPALKKLLSGWRFYRFHWSMYAREGFEGKVHLALDLSHTLAIAPDGKSEIRLQSNNGGPWIQLLDATGVKVADEQDAKLLWEAWCEAHGKRWKDHSTMRESQTVWRLGITSYDQCIASTNTVRVVVKQTHHTRVVIDPETKRVVEWKGIVETSDRREIAIE